MKKLYFAGPDVFRSDASDYFYHVRSYCEYLGAKALIPLDNEVTDHPRGSRALCEALYRGNLKMIEECDAVIANITPFRGVSLDAGTAFEMGYAQALKKPIIAFTFDGRSYKQRVPNPAPSHPVVEDFDLTENLMIVFSCNGIWRSLESAIQWAIK